MTRGSKETPLFSRRDALKTLGVLACGSVFAGCDTLRVAFRAYPRVFDLDPDLSITVLTAFVSTVVPGAPADDPELAHVYFDEDFPFAPYSAFLASDLCDRSDSHFETDRFYRLSEEQRPEHGPGCLRVLHSRSRACSARSIGPAGYTRCWNVRPRHLPG